MNTNVNTTETTVIANAESEQVQTPVYDVNFYTKKALELFDKLGVEGDYTEYGIKQNVRAWLHSKAPLFDLLRKHPNWNEEAKAVVIPAFKEVRENDQDAKWQKIKNLVENCFSQDDIDNFRNMTGNIPSLTLKEITRNQFIEEGNNSVIILNDIFPDLKIHIGQKASRVVNKLMKILGIDKHPEYNKCFAALADACNPLTVNRTSILSVNWLDFMTMSNGNSWSSCHGITPTAAYSGCYKAGCLSYGNDNVSLIFYTIEDGHTEDFFAVKKITRQVIFWQYPVMVQERLYPQCNDSDDGKSSNSVVKQYRELVENIFSVCTETPNLWEKANDIRIYANSDTFMYHDWECFNNWIVKIKDVDIESNEINVGDDCYCLDCGNKKYDEHSEDHERLYCDDCDDSRHYCDHCGEEWDEDDLHYCNDTDEVLCPDCCDYCDYHGEYEATYSTRYVDRNLTQVPNYGYVCQGALESGDFFYCDHCGEYYSCRYNDEHEVDGECWCDDCTSNDAVWCDGCQTYHINDNNLITYEDSITGNLYCEDYAREEDLLVVCEECGCIDLAVNMTENIGEFYCEDCKSNMVAQAVEQTANESENE